MCRNRCGRGLAAVTGLGAFLVISACSSGDSAGPAPTPVATITIAPALDTIGQGQSVQLGATTRDASGNSLSGRTVTWSSSSPGVAATSSTGLVSGVTEGSVTITASSEGQEGVATVVVHSVVATVVVAPALDTLPPAGTAQLMATPKDAAGHSLSGRSVTWTSGSPGIVTVSSSGLVQGIIEGSATITATAEGKNGVATVVVRIPVAVVSVTPASPVLFLGDSLSLTATTTDAMGGTLIGRMISWASSDTTVATVSPAGGLVRGRALGLVTITARSEGKNGTAAVTVDPFAIGNFSAISAGLFSTCGVNTSGAAFCWGDGGFGVLGNGAVTSYPAPVPISGGLTVSSVGKPDFHECAIDAGGAAYCWGRNQNGELGDGSATDRLTPVPVSGGLTFSYIGTGHHFTCGLASGGVAYCWGAGQFYQLGNGGFADSRFPLQVSGGLAFTALAVGFSHACGVASGGTAYCWGVAGSIGDGTSNAAPTPVPVSGGLVFDSLAAGENTTCGLTPSGAAYCWGSNASGELGDGTTSARLAPVPVTGGITFVSINLGSNNSCGVQSGGSAYCWGSNTAGKLGDGTTTPSAVPVAVSGGLQFSSISLGAGSVACGLTIGHQAYCWGDNSHGQLGLGRTSSGSAVPVKVAGQP